MVDARAAAIMGLALLIAACAKDDGGANDVVDDGAANMVVASTPIVENQAAMAAPVANDVAPVPATPPRPAKPVRLEADYRAIGTEPFWSLTIRDGRATLTRPDKPPLPVGTLTRTDDDRAIRYQGEAFTATITAGPCSDGMSDAIWSDRVQIAFAEGVLKGCGGMRDTPEDE